MKNLFLLLTLAIATNSFASVLPDKKELLLNVTVVELVQTANLMPTLDPGLRPVYSKIKVVVEACRQVAARDYNMHIARKGMKFVELTFKRANHFVDCRGPVSKQTLIFNTTRIPAHATVTVANPLSTTRNFVY